MRVEMSALCDAATEAGGKLNILGAFDAIQIPQYPFVIPHCALVFRLRFNRVEGGEHKIRVNFVDQDGKDIMPALEANAQVLIPEGQDSRVTNLIMNMSGLKIPLKGKYSIDLAVDGRHEISLPLTALEINLPEN
tara:strand:- start:649 stop:1053 length:405 start_codon:yes stop_codon:yes gene_type:complete